jgi:putative ABC transport system permease protein
MWRFILSQLRHNRWRAFALGVAIFAATLSFSLFSASARTSELHVRGTITKSYKSAYDILVRPRGSFTPLERERGLVRDNYLSGISGGISFRNYDTIRHLADVSVAAPIANIGFIATTAEFPIRIDRFLSNTPVQLYRLRLTWLANGGLSRYPAGDDYVYFTRRGTFVASDGIAQKMPNGKLLPVCGSYLRNRPITRSPFSKTFFTSLSCYSTLSPETAGLNPAQANQFLPPDAVGTAVAATLPIFISAIDPEQEAKLLGLSNTIVSGRYLKQSDALHIDTSNGDRLRILPVIASTKTYVDDRLQVAIERLESPAAIVPQKLSSKNVYRWLRSLRGPVIAQSTQALQPRYQQALSNRLSPAFFWSVSPVRYGTAQGEMLTPRVTTNPMSIWETQLYPEEGYYPAPLDNQDVQFRQLTPHAASNFYGADQAYNGINLKVVGRFNPAKLPGFNPLTRLPLETYYPPELTAANAATKKALNGKPLAPTQNLGDYISQPPLLLTTLSGLRAFLNHNYFTGASTQAPISAIRVRVSGVTGADRLSQARVRSVALAIHDKTGLDVDVTAGSSPHPLTVALPPGHFGRPALSVHEGWIKKGVAVMFLSAVDQKRWVLLAVIVLVTSFFLANGAYASVRIRQREIGTLRCLGWSSRMIFTVTLTEVGIIGFAAGAAAALVAAVTLDRSAVSLALLPLVGCVLALLGGLVPALLASRLQPIDALRAATRSGTRVRRIRTLTQLALANAVRAPLRSAVAVLALAVTAAALTLLLSVEWAFQGTLAGTLLGSAISIQIGPADLATIGITVALSVLAVADVLYLGLRERAAEFVTLRTLGWSNRHLARVISFEAGLLGIAGAVVGVAVGSTLAGLLALPLPTVLEAAACASLASVSIALVGSLLPLRHLAEATAPTVLAAE